MTTPDMFIDSFGARWQDPPPPPYRAAVLSINLTNALLNPPDDPALADAVAQQTGRDAGVRDYVLNTPGAARIINDAIHELTALRGAANGPVQLLVNCWYGRHRPPAIADAIGHRMQDAGARVQVTHHHINRPPVPRKHPRPYCPFCRITHAAANLPLPDDVGMAPAHYGVHVEARRADGTGYVLLRLGPYTRTWLASRDADRLNTVLEGRAALVIPGFTVTAKDAVFHVSDHDSYADPHGADVTALLADAIAGVSA